MPVLRLACNTLRGRPGRTVLIVAAVALAASLVAGVSCAVASVHATVEGMLSRFIGASDVRIIHQFGGRFDAALLEDARTWDGVVAATARYNDSVSLVRADRADEGGGARPQRITATAIGVDFDILPQFRELTLREGRMPREPHEILIDPAAAEQLNAGAGDALLAQRAGEPLRLTVAGVYDRPSLGFLQRPQIRIDREVLAALKARAGEISAVLIILDDAVDPRAFCEAHADDVPDVLAVEPAEMIRTGFDDRVRASRLGLLVSSLLTFMGAAFIIVTAMTTSVIERQREMAVTRCIGAARGQLFGAQVVVGLLVGSIGAAVGLPLGVLGAWALIASFGEMLPAGLALDARGLVLGATGALGAGLIGAAYPAWLAARVAPLEALARPARPVRARAVLTTVLIALGLVAVQLALLLAPDDPSGRFYAWVYAGLPVVHIAYFIGAVPVLALLVIVLHKPVAWLAGVPADMLRGAMLGRAFRNGFTAGALMVGLSILVSTWSNTQSLMQDWFAKIRFADAFAYRFTGLNEAEQQAIAALPFVEATVPVGYLPLAVRNRQMFGVEGLVTPNVIAIAFEPETFFEINAVEWVAGDPQAAIPALQRGEGILVAERFLTARGVTVGDALTLGMGDVERTFEIVGVVGSGGLDIVTQSFGIRSAYLEHAVSAVFMDFDVIAETFHNRDVYLLQIELADEVSDEDAIEAIADAAPGVVVRSGRWIIEQVETAVGAALAVQSAVAVCALLLAAIGAGNVVAANIHGRRFEYGVLRAVGASRGVVARSILAEALLIALGAAVVGTLLGLHTAAVGTMFFRDLLGLPVRLLVPYGPAAAGWGALIVLALLAALPATWWTLRRRPAALLAAGRND